jgi:hypothetical protein
MDTSGFYKADDDLVWAPNAVWGPGYELLRDEHLSYTYPAEGGWMWFDKVEDAEAHFNKSLPKPKV